MSTTYLVTVYFRDALDDELRRGKSDDGLRRVAQLTTIQESELMACEHAWQSCQNIDNNWRQALALDPERSMMTGDMVHVVVKRPAGEPSRGGRFYIVASVGFLPLQLPELDLMGSPKPVSPARVVA